MNTDQRHRPTAGFTLVELLIVTVALGLLAVFASNFVVSNVLPEALQARGLDAAAQAPEPPPSPAAQLVRRAGLAVLLFGAGFWYLAELRRPGCLDRFRLGQFLLLALTFSLFFVAFAVLHEQQLPAAVAAGGAALLSYPLVALHAASIVDRRFAWSAALPLAALTTGIVVNGAYGVELRALVSLGMLALVIAFLTLSYPKLFAAIERRHRADAERVAADVAALTAPTEQLRSAHGEALVLLRRDDVDEHQGLRAWLEQRARAADETLQALEQLRRRHESATTEAAGRRRRAESVEVGRVATRLRQRVPQVLAALAEAGGNLAAQRARADAVEAPRRDPADVAGAHCVACGHASSADARFCAHCGRPGTERRACRRCARVLHLPRHLLPAPEGAAPMVTHCLGCGERHAAAG